MQRLALSSIDVLSFRYLTDKSFQELKVAFIPTAANVYEDKWFVERDREILQQAGVHYIEFDIAGKTKNEVRSALDGMDVAIVEGGNTFYLLEKVRVSGFDAVIKDLIDQGVIYVGSSAGAVLACPNIAPVKYFDNPADAPNLKNYEGLNFVDFVILPHYEPDKQDENYIKAIIDCKKLELPYQLLTNGQSIIVEGDSWKIVKG